MAPLCPALKSVVPELQDGSASLAAERRTKKGEKSGLCLQMECEPYRLETYITKQFF